LVPARCVLEVKARFDFQASAIRNLLQDVREEAPLNVSDMDFTFPIDHLLRPSPRNLDAP
jgi:hypothetical protein